MHYDDSLYDYDPNNINHEAKLNNGAYLYRLTSITHSEIDDALNGGGPLKSSQPGRFNNPYERASYCANNTLVCIAEILYHMYRTALNRIENRDPDGFILESFLAKRALISIRVSEIDNMVHIDGSDVKRHFDQRMGGTATVFPGPNYDMTLGFNKLLRDKGKRGVFYPSARHSKDICIALFDDETSRIDQGSYKLLNVELRLLPETQPLKTPFSICEPFTDKLHPTMGYYSFDDPAQLADAKTRKTINPADLPEKGIVDFIRRQYRDYPRDAVWY
jgi:hypothetical protein